MTDFPFGDYHSKLIARRANWVRAPNTRQPKGLVRTLMDRVEHKYTKPSTGHMPQPWRIHYYGIMDARKEGKYRLHHVVSKVAR